MFLAPNFLVSDPKFSDLHYKIQPVSHHCGKVSRRLAEGPWRTRGERKKTAAVKYKPVRNYRHRRPNKVNAPKYRKIDHSLAGNDDGGRTFSQPILASKIDNNNRINWGNIGPLMLNVS